MSRENELGGAEANSEKIEEKEALEKALDSLREIEETLSGSSQGKAFNQVDEFLHTKNVEFSRFLENKDKEDIRKAFKVLELTPEVQAMSIIRMKIGDLGCVMDGII